MLFKRNPTRLLWQRASKTLPLICPRLKLVHTPPRFRQTGLAARDALAIARAVVWGKCNCNSPLAAFEEYAAQYRQDVDPSFSIVNFDLNLPKLHNVIEKNLWDEQTVRTTAYQAFLATWERDERLWYLWPGQGQAGVEYEFFEGSVGGPTLILANIANPTHVNWQCEQNPDGIPIQWLVTNDPEHPAQHKVGCIPCRLDGNTVWWTEKCGAIRRSDWTKDCGELLYIKECESL